MVFLIEPINDKDCRIVDIDCYDVEAKRVQEIVIPSTVEQDGKTWQVKDVVCSIFVNKESDATKSRALGRLKKIVISEGIERIGAIMGNDGRTIEERGNAEILREVVLPSTLKVIGSEAFRQCVALAKINIPDGLEEIGYMAFYGCEKLEIFAWPKALRKIELSGISGMKSPEGQYVVNIPDCIEEISGDWAILPNLECNVSAKLWEVLDSSALTKSISRIDIPEGVTKISGIYHKLEHVTFPSSLQVIGDNAFSGSKILNEISEIPASVRVIGDEAFYNSHRIKEEKTIRILSPEISIGKNAFGQPQSLEIRLEADEDVMRSIMAQPGALNGTLIQNIVVPEGVTEVNVEDCPDLVTLSIPDSAQKITLKDIKAEIKASPTAWSNLCAHGCLHDYGNEGELIIPEGVETIREKCFDGCKFSAITLPSTLKEIGVGAFTRCSNISKVTIPPLVTEIKSYTFVRCSSLTAIDFAPGSQLRRICSIPFDVSTIKSMEFPDGMTAIGSQVFIDCETLESLTFPASMREYGDNIVVRCKNLKKVIFLADDPATAVYPVMLGKKVDWFVPDNMVAHVKAYIERLKTEHPELKSAGASAVKPLSKLNSAKKTVSKDSIAKRKATTKQRKANAVYTKPISLSNETRVYYSFAVDEAHVPLLSNMDTRANLFAHYMHTRLDQCSFRFGIWNSGMSVTEDGNTDYSYVEMEKLIMSLDFADVDSLPIGFPMRLQPELVKAGSFANLFANRCPNYKKELRAGAPAYLTAEFKLKVNFDFKIGETATFKKEKIRFLTGWKSKSDSWNFMLIYDDRYIPVASITKEDTGTDVYTFASLGVDGNKEIDADYDPVIEGVRFYPESYLTPALPFVSDIPKFVDYDK